MEIKEYVVMRIERGILIGLVICAVNVHAGLVSWGNGGGDSLWNTASN